MWVRKGAESKRETAEMGKCLGGLQRWSWALLRGALAERQRA